MTSLLFYPLIVILGICSSYTDIKFHKIKNFHLLAATIFGLIIHAGFSTSHNIYPDLDFYLNLFIGSCIGFLLYYTNIWGAGDAKLFIVYCLLMPIDKHRAILPFSSILIFMNIFLLSALAIFILSLGNVLKNGRLLLKKIFSLETAKKLVNSFMIIFGLGWIIPFLAQPLYPYTTPFLITLLLFFSYLLFYNSVYKLKNRAFMYGILAMGLLLRFLLKTLDYSLPHLLAYFKKITSYTFIFYILNVLFNFNKAKEKDNKIIPFAPFMFLGTLASSVNFIYWLMLVLDSLRK